MSKPGFGARIKAKYRNLGNPGLMPKRKKNCSFTHQSELDDVICSVLSQYKRIVVVGLSDDSWRDSNYVAVYLLRQGYEVVPVNPNVASVLGRRSYSDLRWVPGPIEMVEVFRRPEFIPETVDQAIEVQAKVIWIEGGFVDEASAERARKAGLQVITGRCMMIEHDNHWQGKK